MKSHRIVLLMVSAAALSACGGGSTGTGLAVAPPPVPAPAPTPAPTPTFTGFVETSRTALPTTPANTSGTYSGPAYYGTSADDGSGHLVTTQPITLVQDGAASLQIDAAIRTYTLTLAFPSEAGDPATMVLPATSPLGFHVVYVESYSDGSTRPGFTGDRVDSDLSGGVRQAIANGEALNAAVPAGAYPDGRLRGQVTFVTLYNVGHTGDRPRYLSYVNWAQTYVALGADGLIHPVSQSLGGMVFGQRTAAADMPVTGAATYRLQSLIGGDYFASDDLGYNSVFVDVDGDTSLTINFATKMLDAVRDQIRAGDTYQFDEDGSFVLDADGNAIVTGHFVTSLHASGSTMLSNNNDFTLLLSGQAIMVENPLTGTAPADRIEPVSGTIIGAFFGPQAAEVGGIWSMPSVAADGAVGNTPLPFFGLRP